MDVEQLYQTIFDKAPEKVRVQIDGDRKDYDSLRTALVKKNSAARAIAGDLSLCARWDNDTQIATFWLGEPQVQSRTTFKVLDA